jgi:hypothetical protein
MCDPTIGASGNIKSKGKIDVSITWHINLAISQ